MSYITEERKLIQDTARDFALNEVLPIANKLDPEQGDIPMSLREKMGELGYFDPDSGRIWRPWSGRFRIRPGDRGTGAGLDERRKYHRAR